MVNSIRILRKIRKEFDYNEYAEAHYSVKYSNNNELRICCPNCGDMKFKCYINNDKKYFNCFKCDFHSGNYDVFDFVAKTEDLDRANVMLKLVREFSETAPDWQTIIDQCGPLDIEEDDYQELLPIKVLDKMPEGATLLTNKNDPDQKRFWDYLFERGFTEEEVLAVTMYATFNEQCYFCDENNRIRGNIGHRVLIPVYGGNHDLVSWTARSINGKHPKYLNAPNTDMSKTVWPFVVPRGPQCIVVEGIIDALAVRRHGFNAYATLGKKISYEQISLLKEWGITSIVLLYDFDAKQGLQSIINTLKVHFDEVLVPDFSSWPEFSDPGDTLKNKQDGNILMDILIHNLINVNSLEFSVWSIK